MRHFAIVAGLVLALCCRAAPAEGRVVELEIRGGIGVATADYVISGIDHAEEIGAKLVIINMDTPGGLMAPMRDIIQRILGSSVPVATYVTPDGARADSAGTYIMMASHITAMAPTTHLGAATPVALSGEDATPSPPEVPAEEDGEDAGEDAPDAVPGGTAMDRKVLNDAVAYIRGLAERHGRNADWAEDAVVNAATLTASEALQQNVIEFVAASRDQLLEQLNGYEVVAGGQTITLDTGSLVIEEYEPDWRIKVLSVIANPEIVLLLGMIGIYGLMYEAWNPGAIVPGVVGVICLLLAAYALQVLPVNYAGLALILVGVALMTAEAFAPSFGALGLGGIAAFVFGAIMMFDSGIPGFGISVAFVAGLGIVLALLIVALLTMVLKLQKRRSVSGRDAIVGGIGTAMADFSGEGKVWLEGEAWSAFSRLPVSKDQQVVVTALDGLVLTVEPAPRDMRAAQPQT